MYFHCEVFITFSLIHLGTDVVRVLATSKDSGVNADITMTRNIGVENSRQKSNFRWIEWITEWYFEVQIENSALYYVT